MKSITDLLENRKPAPKGKPLDERAELIQFFHKEDFKHLNGKPFTARELGVRCAHIDLKGLYYIKSVYLDEKRRGRNAGKYFMGVTKLHPVRERLTLLEREQRARDKHWTEKFANSNEL